MKTTNLTTIICLLMFGQVSRAENCSKEQLSLKPLTTDFYDRDTVKQALYVVLQSHAITFETKKGTQINRNLIEEMRREGLIQAVDPRVAVICIDPSN